MLLTLISGFKPVYKSFEKIVLALLCNAGSGRFRLRWRRSIVPVFFSLFIYLVISGYFLCNFEVCRVYYSN